MELNGINSIYDKLTSCYIEIPNNFDVQYISKHKKCLCKHFFITWVLILMLFVKLSSKRDFQELKAFFYRKVK